MTWLVLTEYSSNFKQLSPPDHGTSTSIFHISIMSRQTDRSYIIAERNPFGRLQQGYIVDETSIDISRMKDNRRYRLKLLVRRRKGSTAPQSPQSRNPIILLGAKTIQIVLKRSIFQIKNIITGRSNVPPISTTYPIWEWHRIGSRLPCTRRPATATPRLRRFLLRQFWSVEKARYVKHSPRKTHDDRDDDELIDTWLAATRPADVLRIEAANTSLWPLVPDCIPIVLVRIVFDHFVDVFVIATILSIKSF
jgi:hypothetical protein